MDFLMYQRDQVLKLTAISKRNRFIDCRNATLSILASLLSDCESPSWLLANEKLLTIVEYMLWDAARLGLSQHLSGTAPCLLYDLERLLALVRKALGKGEST